MAYYEIIGVRGGSEEREEQDAQCWSHRKKRRGPDGPRITTPQIMVMMLLSLLRGLLAAALLGSLLLGSH
jgi:hypothetical protein